MKKGFTLAEVLITLGIIGVVAAMTMPTLINNHREKETVVKLKKLNSTLQNAYNIMRQEEYGSSINSIPDYGTNDEFIDNFTKYLKVQNVCHEGEIDDCFIEKSSYKTIGNGVGTTMCGSDSTAFVLADGTVVIVSHHGTATTYKQLFVDLNGKNPPNTFGKDAFSFIMNTQKIVPRGSVALRRNDTFRYDASGYCDRNRTFMSQNGLGCTAWVINMGNMDYLRK